MTETSFKIDQKGRVSLSKIIPEGTVTLKGHYDYAREEIVLKPYSELPMSTWLLDNPKQFKGLKKGIKDAKEGKITRYNNVKELLKELED